MNAKYQKTIYACFVGYVVQAIINNFVPLLFLTFESTYQIPLSRITILITFNFGIQLLVDLIPGFNHARPYFFGGGAAGTCRAAGDPAQRLCRAPDLGDDLCPGGRAFGGAGQPDRGELSHGQ